MTFPQSTGRKTRAGRAAPGRPQDQRSIIVGSKVKNKPAAANNDAELDQQQADAEEGMKLGDAGVSPTHKIDDLSATVDAGALVRFGSRSSPYSARGPPPGIKLLSYPQLKLRGIPYSRSHLRRLEATGHFPQHITLGEGLGALIAWPEHEVDQWIAERMARRVRAGQAASISTP
jgi:prophage regulatory protein